MNSISGVNPLYPITMTPVEAGHALFQAIEDVNEQEVRHLLTLGADVTVKNKDGYTPLVMAAVKGDLGIVKLLLEAKADPNQKFAEGGTVFNDACGYGNIPLCKLLIEYGADPHDLGDKNNNALHTAISYDQPTVLGFLLQLGLNPDQADDDGETPLHVAVQKRDVAACELLISHKININAVNKKFYTPLHQAAASGCTEICHLLLSYGADPHATTIEQETALHLAAINKQASPVPLLLQHDINPIALEYHNRTALEFFLDYTTERPEALDLSDAGFTDTFREIKKFINTFSAKLEKLVGGVSCKALADFQTSLRLYLRDHDLPEEVFEALLSTQAVEARLSEGAPICLMPGWFRHTTAVVLWGNLLCKCNRGDGAEETGIQIFEIGQREKVIEAVERLMSKTVDEESEREAAVLFFNREINALLELKHLYTYKMPPQRSGNCYLLAPRLAFRALLQLYFYRQNIPFARACKEAKNLYSDWHHFDNQLVLATADPLFDALERDPRFVDVIDISKLALSVLKANLHGKNLPLLDWLSKRFLQAGDVINKVDGAGNTLLLNEIADKKVESVCLLLSLGANPNLPCANGLMPLHYAILLGSVEMCQLLLEHGAHPNEPKPILGETPLYLAASREHKKIYELLIAKGATLGDSIPIAVCDPVTINFLLEAGMDPNTIYNGFSLLVMAVILEQLTVVRLLLAYRANPNAQAGDGATALHVAAKKGNKEICKLLIEAGADPTIKDEEGRTPLDMLQKEHAHLIPILTPKQPQ